MKNMNKKYNLAVVIGRFQPFHLGHEKLIKYAETVADEVLILIGSANAHISIKNPFTAVYRQNLIEVCHPNAKCGFLNDMPYDEAGWIKQVQYEIHKHEPGASVCIVGHNKDESSYYLNSFPQYDVIDPGDETSLNATDIRKSMFDNNLGWIRLVPPQVTREMIEFAQTELYDNLVEEHKYITDYKKSFDVLPFPPVFVTCDSVVYCAGHVLMIQRLRAPGKGMWALPGGFIDQDERAEDGIIRELREETRIDVPPGKLKNSLKRVEVFDDPNRSLRGRTITHAGLINLVEKELPKVKAADDAADAVWFPLFELRDMANNNQIFEDHIHIVNKMVSFAK